MDHAIVKLSEALEHERERRSDLTESVRKHRKDRETDRAKDRATYALAQLQAERDVRSLAEDMGKLAGRSLK